MNALRPRDVKAALEKLENHMKSLRSGEQKLPWVPGGNTLWHAVSGHMAEREETTGKKLGEQWFMCLVFVTKDLEEFKRVFAETRQFLRSKGTTFEEFKKNNRLKL